MSDQKSRPLTERARKFAQLFAGDGSDAARRAGYSGSLASLRSVGSRLLSDPRVRALLAARGVNLAHVDASRSRRRKPDGAQHEVEGEAPHFADPLALYRWQLNSPTVRDADRQRAGVLLARAEAEEVEDASRVQSLGALAAKIREVLEERPAIEQECAALRHTTVPGAAHAQKPASASDAPTPGDDDGGLRAARERAARRASEVSR
jgi:hypothetical protein